MCKHQRTKLIFIIIAQLFLTFAWTQTPLNFKAIVSAKEVSIFSAPSSTSKLRGKENINFEFIIIEDAGDKFFKIKYKNQYSYIEKSSTRILYCYEDSGSIDNPKPKISRQKIIPLTQNLKPTGKIIDTSNKNR